MTLEQDDNVLSVIVRHKQTTGRLCQEADIMQVSPSVTEWS